MSEPPNVIPIPGIPYNRNSLIAGDIGTSGKSKTCFLPTSMADRSSILIDTRPHAFVKSMVMQFLSIEFLAMQRLQLLGDNIQLNTC